VQKWAIFALTGSLSGVLLSDPIKAYHDDDWKPADRFFQQIKIRTYFIDSIPTELICIGLA
jgi:hypothetical protein